MSATDLSGCIRCVQFGIELDRAIEAVATLTEQLAEAQAKIAGLEYELEAWQHAAGS